MSSLPNSRWESRKRSDPTSGWFSTSVWSTPPGGGRWRRPSGEPPRGRAAALPHRGGRRAECSGSSRGGWSRTSAGAASRRSAPSRFPDTPSAGGAGGNRRGASGGGPGPPPPPPPRGETEIPDGGRNAGRHPVRGVQRGGPVRLRASHEERPERDALHLGGADVDQAGAVCRRPPASGRGVRLYHVPHLFPRLPEASLSPEGDSLSHGIDGAQPALLPAVDGADPRGNFCWKFGEFCERITRFKW